MNKVMKLGAVALLATASNFANAELVPLSWDITELLGNADAGSVSAVEGSEGQWSLSYEDTGVVEGTSYIGSWEISTTAAEDGSYSFDWDLSTIHSWHLPTLRLVSFTTAGESVIYDGDASGINRNHFGATSFSDMTTGDVFGFRIEGSHYDAAMRLEGVFNIVQSGYESVNLPPAASVPAPAGVGLLALAMAGFGFRRKSTS